MKADIVPVHTYRFKCFARIERVLAEIRLFELAVRLARRETCIAESCVKIFYMIKSPSISNT